MSETVSKALLKFFGTDAEGSAEFVGNIDKFFDIMNVRNYVEGPKARKDFKMPYRSVDDSRLKVSCLL